MTFPTRIRTRVVEITEATTAGVRRHLLDLVTHLDPAGFSPSVLVADFRDPGFQNDMALMRRQGITVEVIPMHRQINLASDLRALLQIRQYLAELPCDVVHTHSSKGGFLGRVAATLARVPRIIHTPHVFPFQMEGLRPSHRWLYLLLERAAARRTHRFICVSEHERAVAVTQGVAPEERIVVIPNGVDTDQFKPAAADPALRSALKIPDGAPVVGMAARFTRQKGHIHLIEAARSILNKLPTTRFLLAGDGNLRPGIQLKVYEAGLEDSFIFAGSREDMPALYPLMDVVVVPSVWESLPYALLEAMSCSCAVVASRVGGIAELVHDGYTGRLVEPGEPAALAKAVVSILQDPGMRRLLGTKARERILSFNRLDTMVRAIETVYEPRVLPPPRRT